MIDFLRYRWVCLFFSAALMVGGTALYFIKGGFRYHVDFQGGTQLRLEAHKPIEISRLRSTLEAKGWHDAEVQSVGGEQREFLVSVGVDQEKVEERFKQHVLGDFAEEALTIQSVDSVGAAAGKEVTWNAMMAIFLSLLAILAYLAVTTKWSYGLGAIVALAHDLPAVLIVLLILNEPISLNVLAGVLSVLGYSINDTIVIFSRIRENIGLSSRNTAEEIVNISINQTLSRTLLTSFATLLSVTALLLLGGDALRGFAITLFVGIIIGTYSSIYVASPVMLLASGNKIE